MYMENTDRILKFRAWCRQKQRMYYQGTEGLETIQSFMQHHGDKFLMQFTGQKDSCGNEIYDGDIIRVDVDQRKVRYLCVSYSNYFMHFSADEVHTGVSFCLGWENHSNIPYKVIDNIAENPKWLVERYIGDENDFADIPSHGVENGQVFYSIVAEAKDELNRIKNVWNLLKPLLEDHRFPKFVEDHPQFTFYNPPKYPFTRDEIETLMAEVDYYYHINVQWRVNKGHSDDLKIMIILPLDMDTK